MSFTYTTGVPNPPNLPAIDVGPMQVNTNSINSIIAVDHVGFNTSGGGKHLKVTFNSENPPAALPVDPVSIEFTAKATSVGGTVLASAGVLTSPAITTAQDFYASSVGVFPLSCIKAFCVFTATTTNGAQTVLNGFNVSSVVKTISSPNNIYTINLVPNSTTSTNFVPFVNFSSTQTITTLQYSYTTSANTLNLLINTGFNANLPENISILILQV